MIGKKTLIIQEKREREVKINLKSILQAFTSTLKISLVLSHHLECLNCCAYVRTILQNKWQWQHWKNNCYIVTCIVCTARKHHSFPFFSMLLSAQVSPEWYLQSVQMYRFVVFLMEIAPPLCEILRLRGREKKKKKDREALDLQIICHSRSGSANFPH